MVYTMIFLEIEQDVHDVKEQIIEQITNKCFFFKIPEIYSEKFLYKKLNTRQIEKKSNKMAPNNDIQYVKVIYHNLQKAQQEAKKQ